jgi:hypothetical protein
VKKSLDSSQHPDELFNLPLPQASAPAIAPKQKTAGTFPCRRSRLTCCNDCVQRRQNRPDRMQHFLKAFVRSTGARIVAAKLLDELLIPMDNPHAALYVRFRWEPAPALTHRLESKAVQRTARVRVAWDTSAKGG